MDEDHGEDEQETVEQDHDPDSGLERPESSASSDSDNDATKDDGNHSGGTKRATSVLMSLLRLQSSENKTQCLAKSSPYAGLSAGAEVARLRKGHVWCLLDNDDNATHNMKRHVYIHIYIYICTYIYIYTYIHTYIHIYMYT